MPLRIIEKEKEGHRKVKTDFRKKRQKEYMEKHGPQQPRRKRLAVTDKYKKLKPFTRTGKQFGGRTNLLEEMGRLDSERMNPNRRAEKSRVMGELNM